MRPLLLIVFVTCTNAGTCFGQVVVLPTFRTFQYSGSVLVPDGGAAHLGSVSRMSESRNRSGWGPLGSRSAGRSVSRNTLSAHVRIIDLAEMDRQLLGAEPQEFMRRQRAGEEPAHADPAPIDPVEQAKQHVRDARQCAEKGYFKAADYYYRRAISELPPELAVIAQAEYDRFGQRDIRIAKHRDQR